jgi:hypothetical protein
MVNIALGNAPVTACEAGDADRDGEITVDEILAAVNNALSGCPPDASHEVRACDCAAGSCFDGTACAGQ